MNLALKKDAWQSTGGYYTVNGSIQHYLGPALAVDGLKENLSWKGGQCAASIGFPTSEWRVDLGGTLSMHHIFIQYMSTNVVRGAVSFFFNN